MPYIMPGTRTIAALVIIPAFCMADWMDTLEIISAVSITIDPSARFGRARRTAAGSSPCRLARIAGGLARGFLRRRLLRSLRMFMLVIRHVMHPRHPLHVTRVRPAAVRVMILARTCFGLGRVVLVVRICVRGGTENRACRKNYRCQCHPFHLLPPSSVVKKIFNAD